MTYWATLRNGGQMLLGEPKEAVLSYDAAAPADQLKAVFPADRIWEELVEVLAYEAGQGVFRGVVDEQNTRLTPDGLFVELICRSREALLLDNEAEPRSIRGASLESLRAKLLEPLGFTKVTGGQEALRGELAVEKGSSVWQVLARFCGECFGTEPYVDFEGVLHCEGREAKRLRLGRVMSAQVSQRPCKRLSAVWKQGYRGGYDTLYSDAGAALPRRRYLSAQSGRNPRQVLDEAKRESFLLTVTCAGNWWPPHGALADVSVPRAGRFESCRVRQAVYYRDGSGERTRFTLEGGSGHVAD